MCACVCVGGGGGALALHISLQRQPVCEQHLSMKPSSSTSPSAITPEALSLRHVIIFIIT